MSGPKSRAAAVVVTGPLASFKTAYAAELHELGYTPLGVVKQLRQVASVSRWVEQSRLGAADLSEEVLEQFLAIRPGSSRPDAVGFLYLDGHVRVYSGTRALPKTHIARMRIAGPATEETWVGDADGDPVMVITAAPSQSLAAELARLLPDLRALIGRDRRCTVVFDRGGYSPQVFTEIITAGFDVLTYFKGAWARSALEAFQAVDFVAPDGSPHSYQLA